MKWPRSRKYVRMAMYFASNKKENVLKPLNERPSALSSVIYRFVTAAVQL